MQAAKEDKIDELRSFYAGLLLPELIVKPSALTGWSRFLKWKQAVGEKIADDILAEINRIKDLRKTNEAKGLKSLGWI